MFGNDFFPTPSDLIDRMLACVDLDTVKNILEPSAGRGDIVERIQARHQYGRKYNIDTIEIDDELGMVLEGKGCKPVSRDFLTFRTYKPYDLVIMNPPFSDGDKHLMKALEIVKDGGHVVCLLNAETLRNPYTNSRQVLSRKLTALDARIEYIKDGFRDAARKTTVEVALVDVVIPPCEPQSDILSKLREAKTREYANGDTSSEVVDGDYLVGAVRRYEVEAEAGLKLLDEYMALKPILTTSFGKDYSRSIIEIEVDGDKYAEPRTAFITRLRMKYWQQLFQSCEFSSLFTSKVRERYSKAIEDLARFEFNMTNIRQMQIDISGSMLQSLDDQIVALFDEFSNQYYDEQSNNIHYYNGWKTNKAYVVNKKVITQLYLWSSYGSFNKWKLSEKMADIHKVFAYLNGTLSTDLSDLERMLSVVSNGQTRKIRLPYCTIDVFKKGTCHITFNDEKLLKKFNLVGSQRKGWLPPAYGSKSYESMTGEERQVVDEFEGQESYSETVENQAFYALKPQLVLGTGQQAEAA